MTERPSRSRLQLQLEQTVDLNELLHRHQISLMCAKAASCPEARIAHRGMADLYEDRIRALRPANAGAGALIVDHDDPALVQTAE